MDLSTIVDKVNSRVWGPPLIILCLRAGIFFSFWTRFFQLRHFKNVVAQLWHGNVLKDYEQQLKEGCPMHFYPEKLGIKNTECWE